jgi:ribosomal protein S12 methylthiotransferase accessory factor
VAEPVFAELAAALLAPQQPVGAEAAGLLAWLGLPRHGEVDAAVRHRARMFQAAAGFERLFQLEAPAAPGMVVFGAEVAPDALAAAPGLGLIGVSGTGLSPLEALESCIGEGLELLSQVETLADLAQQRAVPPDGALAGLPAAWKDAAALPAAWRQAGPGWMPVRRLRDGATTWVPAGLCFRRPGATAPWPLSIGCAAGPSADAAALHGLLEVVERDAAALWWRGGRRPRPLALEHPALAGAAALLARLRQGSAGRRSWLLDITTDLGVPVVAAVSVGPDGAGFCCGLAARPGLAAACRAALLELCQMELALAVVAAKREEGGEAALNPRDLSHQARFTGIHAARCALLHPLGEPAPATLQPPEAAAAEALAGLVAALAARGFDALLLPLTRPALGVPVCRMLCPGLEVEPAAAVGPRLAAMITETGGGDCLTNGIPLM